MWCILGVVEDEHRRKYRVRCACGYVGLRRITHVCSGRTSECKSCSARTTASKFPLPVHSTGAGLLSGTMWTAIKAGAKKRGIVFDLSPEYAWDLFENQDRKCALSGVPIILSRKIKNNNADWNEITASLDRIDSGVGYVEGNVQWVHKEVNYIKRDLDQNRFVVWCRLIGGSCGS
jgi:hypothetical protein